MASVFKRGRDKEKQRAFWYVSYNDHTGKRRMKKGYTDKGLTEQLAAKIEQEVMLRRRGLIDPEDERRLKTKSSPIKEHLEAFKESLGENTSKYVKLTMTRVRRVIKDAKSRQPWQLEDGFCRYSSSQTQKLRQYRQPYLQPLRSSNR